MRQRGMTLIELLVVMSILAVIGGTVVVLIPKVWFARDKAGCIDNVRQIVSLLETGRSTFAERRECGCELLLSLAARGELRGAAPLKKLFCPGDEAERFPGAERYASLVLDGRAENAALTSYAGRDTRHPAWQAARGRSDVVVLIADDSDDHHGGRGIVVGLTGGAAQWRDKVDDYRLPPDAPLLPGAAADVEELAYLR